MHSVHGETLGATEIIHVRKQWNLAFSGIQLDVVSTSHYESLVEVHWVIRGTHHGAFGANAPTGKTNELPVVTLFSIVNFTIIEIWSFPNMEHLRIQLQIEKQGWDSSFSLVHLLS